ncbi:MAG: hypothetical protein HY326_01755 [Chloroflexi bacterium]|nr:hypothetical protein [Chloroflexota bacterium]
MAAAPRLGLPLAAIGQLIPTAAGLLGRLYGATDDTYRSASPPNRCATTITIPPSMRCGGRMGGGSWDKRGSIPSLTFRCEDPTRRQHIQIPSG